MAVDFTIGEFGFQVGNLKVKNSLAAFKKLAKTLLPAIAEAQSAPDGQTGNAVQRVVENLDSLDDLLDLFVAVSKYTGPGAVEQNPLPLKDFVEHVFGGRPEMMLEFIVRSVQGEYGAFLKEDGPLGPLMARAGLPGKASA